MNAESDSQTFSRKDQKKRLLTLLIKYNKKCTNETIQYRATVAQSSMALKIIIVIIFITIIALTE